MRYFIKVRAKFLVPMLSTPDSWPGFEHYAKLMILARYNRCGINDIICHSTELFCSVLHIDVVENNFEKI